MARYLHLNMDETAPALARDWIDTECQRAALPNAINVQIATCVVEAVNNAIAHRCEDKQSSIRLKLHRRRQCMVICIREKGPSAEGKLATQLPEADAVGGRGWFILNSWMDLARYKRCGEHNVVTLAKRLP